MPTTPTHTLTIDSTSGGSVINPGEGTFSYHAGRVVELESVPMPGYRFVNWTGDVGTVSDVNAAHTSISIGGDYHITANFVRTHTLAITSTAGGTVVIPGEGLFTFDEGDVVPLLAQPASLYCFDRWTGDVGTIADVHAAATTITMNGDYVITANFVPMYRLTVDSTDGGQVTVPGEGDFYYCPGTVVNLVTVPDPWYEFVEWIGDVADPDYAATTVTMDSDKAVIAKFRPIIPVEVGIKPCVYPNQIRTCGRFMVLHV